MTTPDSTKTYHANSKKFFEKTAQEKAKETKFVQRNSPINGPVFLLSLVLVVLQHGVIVLEQLAKTANAIYPQLGLKGQAFKERYNDFAVQFLKAMFVEALKTTAPKADQLIPLLSNFTAVNLLDSSFIKLPEKLGTELPGYGGAASKAAAKIYLVLDWLTGAYDTIHIEAGRKADQNMGEHFLPGSKPGALWLFDLGFFKAALLAAIANFGSFFLCRLAASQQVFWVRNDEEELVPFNLDLLLRYAARDLFEIEVVFGANQEVTARLIIAPVPPKVVAERRRKAKESARKQGRTLSQTTLNRLAWTLLLANASPEQLPTSTVLEVYCVRWQIELVFKLFKSDAKLETTSATEPNRVKCEFYAKLIAVLLFNRISGWVEEYVGEKISPVKLWRRMSDDRESWLQLLGKGTSSMLGELLEFLSRYVQPSSRKKYPSTLQRLEQAAREARQRYLKDPLGYLREKMKMVSDGSRAFVKYFSTHKVELNSERLFCQISILTP